LSPAEFHSTSYKEQIARASARRKTRLILAIDSEGAGIEELYRRTRRLLDQTLEHLCAVKLGRQTVLNLGTKHVHSLTRIIHDNGIPCIIDDKVNDIGETNRAIAYAYFRLGFDGLTANPFAGWRDGLQPLFQTAHSRGKGVILLGYMSHLGASEGYGQRVLPKGGGQPRLQYELFAQKALRWKADGIVVGATRPGIVREFKSILRGVVPIYSPGVGVQGGQLGEALRAGTDYFIVGRSITRDRTPEKAARGLAEKSWKNS
jgi:orotidine-5'-phosphate decarboxylase